MCDRRGSLRDIARQKGISFAKVQFVLTAILGMSTICYMGPQNVDQRSEEEEGRSEEEARSEEQA